MIMEADVNKPPVKVGDQHDVTIENIGSKGDGIAKINRYAIIVRGVQVGDQVKVEIIKVFPKFAFASVVQ